MPKGRPTEGKYIKHKVEIYGLRNCFIHKRPRSSVWQYYLQLDGEGTIKKSTKIQGDNDDINVGLEEARLFTENKYHEARARIRRDQLIVSQPGNFLRAPIPTSTT